MTIADKRIELCTCNGTLPVDAAALAQALGLSVPPAVGRVLCQRELAGFAARSGGDMIVGCTQETRLLGEAAEEGGRPVAITFVNLREHAGWSRQGQAATPKMAALLAAAALPPAEPVPSVSYRSEGQLLIVGPADAALYWAGVLSPQLPVTVLITSRGGPAEVPAERAYPVQSGTLTGLSGWLGAFEATWQQENPIDLDLCTRCGACVRACPEHAIDWGLQVDLDRCRDHRACVAACGEVRAIDFNRGNRERHARFDLVLDLARVPHLRAHEPPQGYFAPGADALAQAQAAAALTAMVGEFEKPKYFAYKASICAHSRSRKTGCSQCIDVCSTGAITADGDHVRVEPHLCMGCGGCATVCPSGAMTYAYPTVPQLARRMKIMLEAYAAAGGTGACPVFYGPSAAAALVGLGRRGPGLPARMLPIEVHHVASLGMDVWLAALAYGASQVVILTSATEAPSYVEALEREMRIAETILQALGYQGGHLRLIDASDAHGLEAALWTWPDALGVRVAATFSAAPEKRRTLDLALEHLARHAPIPRTEIALPAGAAFGSLDVDREACTLCLACVGSCPEGALLDHPDALRLRFIETNCVQCGLCANTCPEQAIRLVPRLNLTAEARAPRVLNEATILSCTSCGKPLGSDKVVASMIARLAGHSMFASEGALDRLKMCADCRVIDLMHHDNVVPRRNG